MPWEHRLEPMGSGEAAVKEGTSWVRAEGCAGVGQAAREGFVQREEGTQRMRRTWGAVLSGRRMECGVRGEWRVAV